MALQESIYSDTTLSDFSAVLSRASEKNQNSQFKGDGSVNTSPNDCATPMNHNLSSLLSQIQDDGPAYRDSVNRKQSKENSVREKHESRLNNADVSPVFSSQLKQSRKTHAAVLDNKTNNSIWVLFFLVSCFIALLAFTLFRLDIRTIKLEESFSSYGASMQENMLAQTQQKATLANITNTNETLQSIKKELKLIKTDYSVLDDKYNEFVAKREQSTTDNTKYIQKNVTALNKELVTLKGDLLTIKNNFIKTDKKTTKVKRAATNRGLVVSLASLSNKIKAEEILEQLYEAGYIPLIQQAVVNGKRVYRLSVSGFSNSKEAELFIRKAGKQYGMKDGFLRKS